MCFSQLWREVDSLKSSYVSLDSEEELHTSLFTDGDATLSHFHMVEKARQFSVFFYRSYNHIHWGSTLMT